MGSRLELQTLFENILGSRNVYYNPPESVKMNYDAIVYGLSGKDLKRANDKIYQIVNQYDGIVITLDPDSTIPDTLLESFKMISFGKPYIVDNLNHFPFTLYY